MINFEAL